MRWSPPSSETVTARMREEKRKQFNRKQWGYSGLSATDKKALKGCGPGPTRMRPNSA
jgi:hypothetical protein